MSKTGTFTSFRDFTVIFRILFFDRFWCFRRCFTVIFSRSMRKSDLKTCIVSSKSRIFFAWPFLPGDLTWPWPLLWSWSTVNDTYKCQRHWSMPISWLCLCLASQSLLADVTKPEMSNILTLTWPVTALVTPRPIKCVFLDCVSRAFECRLNV